MSKFQFLDSQAAFALRVKQLHDRLYEQMDDALVQSGLKLHAKTTGIVQLLYQEGPCSVGQIAERLRYSHQLATQRLSWLLDRHYAESERDPDDLRRRRVVLTKTGVREAKKLQDFLPRLSASYSDLFTETGLNLDAAISAADEALKTTPLIKRFPDEAH
ncbi:MAG: MarR family transcriptional regulator [Pseudomonadota bacterium]